MIELSAAHEGAGGKARGLAKLIAAGVAVPPGFALTGAAFRAVIGEGAAAPPATLDELGHVMAAWARAVEEAEIPPALEREVFERARALTAGKGREDGGLLIVRSSMSFEDDAAGAAPGLGRSVQGVPVDADWNVWNAIRLVWAASLTPLVDLYARGRVATTPGWPGVVVQRWIAGDPCTVYTRAPGRPEDDEVWLDAWRGKDHERRRRDDVDPRIALAVAAERAIGAERGADVELAGIDGAWTVVQARPLVHPKPRTPREPAPAFLLSALASSGKTWRRDVTHNPDPMSVAQTGLCERVERSGVAPYHLAVVAGFLYTAPREDVPAVTVPASALELETAFTLAAAEVDEILSGADGEELPLVLDAYVAAYRILVAELAPVIAAARKATEHVGDRVTTRPSSIAAIIAQAVRGEIGREALLETIGDSAPAWDVACPTFAETPERIDTAVLRARARLAAPSIPSTGLAPRCAAAAATPAEPADETIVALARAAADVSERDDFLFARAQATVRRALLDFADRAGLARDDVFWLPLDELTDGIDVQRAAGRASAARAAAKRAAQWQMPIVVGEEAKDPGQVAEWYGSGIGGWVTGPAVRITSLGDAEAVRPGAIIVTAAVTPAMALVVEGAAAIVCEHGSLLDHGAAMARELGIPCVVGCAGIIDAIDDGETLVVDGDSGTVSRG